MNWETKKFSQIMRIRKGEAITKASETEGPYPVILGGQEPAYYINRYNHEGKAIVISRSGASAGYASFWNEPIFITDGFLVEPLGDNLIEYIFYLLKYYGKVLRDLQNGSAIPHVTPKIIYNLRAPIPSKDIQRKLVEILSAYDNLIEINNKRIKVLEQMAENLYKEWFVHFRFPGHKNATFENGIPKGWKYRRLNELLDVRYGKDHKNIGDGTIPIFGSGGLMRYGDKALYNGEAVLIPRKGSLNNIMYYNAPFWTVDTMFYSIPLIPNFAKYVYYLLSNVDMDSYNSGAALPSMTTDILYHFKVLVPDEKVLMAFDSFISDVFCQKKAIQKVNESLIKQRDLLLPRLMSGKLEVK